MSFSLIGSNFIQDAYANQENVFPTPVLSSSLNDDAEILKQIEEFENQIETLENRH